MSPVPRPGPLHLLPRLGHPRKDGIIILPPPPGKTNLPNGIVPRLHGTMLHHHHHPIHGIINHPPVNGITRLHLPQDIPLPRLHGFTHRHPRRAHLQLHLVATKHITSRVALP